MGLTRLLIFSSLASLGLALPWQPKGGPGYSSPHRQSATVTATGVPAQATLASTISSSSSSTSFVEDRLAVAQQTTQGQGTLSAASNTITSATTSATGGSGSSGGAVASGSTAVTNSAGLSWYASGTTAGVSSPTTTYSCFGGQPSAYPAFDAWISFTEMWTQNKNDISSSNGGDTTTVGYIESAITQVAGESNVDARVILAIMMQESTGQASIQCTGDGNCGLLQGPTGSSSYDSSNSQSSILTMIRQGMEGVGSSGGGLVQYINGATGTSNPYPGNIYAAVRGYNSGETESNLDDGPDGSTGSYANDIAMRLLGWTGDSGGDYSSC